MDETRGEPGGPPDPCRSAVRRYTLALHGRIVLAVHERTVRGGADADGRFADAERLAENGIPLLEDWCEGGLSAGWAARFICSIAALRYGGGDQSPAVLAARSVAYFDDAIVELEAALAPEDRMPLGLEYIAGVALLLRDADSPHPAPPRGPGRVRVPARRPGGDGRVVVVVDGIEVELKGQHRLAFRTALEKMSAALGSGRVGVAFEEMKNYQGAISYFRNTTSLGTGRGSSPRLGTTTGSARRGCTPSVPPKPRHSRHRNHTPVIVFRSAHFHHPRGRKALPGTKT
jgi:hypothetical protein